MPAPLNDRDRKIAELRRAGKKYNEIAAELGLHQSQVYQSLYKAGLVGKGLEPGGGLKSTAENKKKVVAMRRAGATYMEIATELNMSTGVVNRILNEAGMVGKRYYQSPQEESDADNLQDEANHKSA